MEISLQQQNQLLNAASGNTTQINSLSDFNEHENSGMLFPHPKNSQENIRRLSTEASSELSGSSRCASGQVSPSLQSPTRLLTSKSSSIFLNENDFNKFGTKSPKQTRDHR